MKKKVLIILSCILVIIAILASTLYIFPLINENECKNRVYNDMKSNITQVKDSVIGVLPMTEENDSFSFDGGGSGVIFDYKNDKYYAVTARHCVDDEKAKYKVYTTKTPDTKAQDLGELSEIMDVPDESFYKSLEDVTVEYISDITDLAIISFSSKYELTVAKIADKNPEVDDRIMCIGNPDREKFTVTYGQITSELHTIQSISQTDSKVITSDTMEHNAYIYFGNSGGPAFNEDMQVSGITTSSSFNLLNIFVSGDIVPCNIVSDCIESWKSNK